MIKKLLGLFAYRAIFREDPFFRISVDQKADSNIVRITVQLLGSNRIWDGRFAIKADPNLPLDVSVPNTYPRNGEYFEIHQPLSPEEVVSIEFSAIPLEQGSASIEFWFEAKVGLGGTTAVIPAPFGFGDPVRLEKARKYYDTLYNKWVDENSRDETKWR